MNERKVQLSRKTGETDVSIEINLDGTGKYDINTGIGFFDHMLSLTAKHGCMDFTIKAVGDLNVDSHHTVEDVGIVLGSCFKKAMGDKVGIKRYGTAFVPMDESMASVSLDAGGRPYMVFEGNFTTTKLGGFDTELTEEFLRAFAFNAGLTLHAKIPYGSNNHHMAEALFKALGKALDEATSYDDRIKGVMSTKGIL